MNIFSDLGTVTETIRPAEQLVLGGFVEFDAVRILDGNTTLWLEYRQPVGVDTGMRQGSSGVLVYLETDTCYLTICPVLQSKLLDMTPGVGGRTFDNAVLPVGSSWRNPLGHVRLTVNSADATGVQVTMTWE